MMMWSITDEVIENPLTRATQFKDIQTAGFDGVAIFVRCSRYSWDEAEAIGAQTHIQDMCREKGMHLWIGADPRMMRPFDERWSGANVLLFGNCPMAGDASNLVQVVNGRFSVRCEYHPRPVHTLRDCAVDYLPLGITKVYAVRRNKQPLTATDIQDITSTAHYFINARDRYVEAHGFYDHPKDERWSVVAFFHFATNHFDFSNPIHLSHYENRLKKVSDAGLRPYGIQWDEPGYTCIMGSLPFTPVIRETFRDRTTQPLKDLLWKLVFEVDDESHITVRKIYYSLVQETVDNARMRCITFAQTLWGEGLMEGIHDSWRWESADMSDMNHGSLDLWRAGKNRNGGYIDLGSVNLLREAQSPFYKNLATVLIAGTSLARNSNLPVVFNNLWTSGDDEGRGWQVEVLAHCVRAMALFGHRWIAHIYGPAGILGQERSFLGLPDTPGYPTHNTWLAFPEWLEILKRHHSAIAHQLPFSNLLVVFPVETMYALADARANVAASDIFNLLLALLDCNYHVELAAPSSLERAYWQGGHFFYNERAYDAVVYPWPNVLPENCKLLIGADYRRMIFAFSMPQKTVQNEPVLIFDKPEMEIQAVLDRLSSFSTLRPVAVPQNTWVTMTNNGEGTVISVMPSRVGGSFSGVIQYEGREYTILDEHGLIRLLFTGDGVRII